jgi:hypothetical protein
MEGNKMGFFKDHADTLAIIGVNLAIGAFMLSFMISTSHRVDAANVRLDAANVRMDTVQMMIYDMLKEGRK